MERTKKVQMSMRALAEMIKKHYGLPPDAAYQGSEYDAGRDIMTVTLSHQTFDLVKEPEVIKPSETVSAEPKKTEDKSQPKKKEEKTWPDPQ